MVHQRYTKKAVRTVQQVVVGADAVRPRARGDQAMTSQTMIHKLYAICKAFNKSRMPKPKRKGKG